MAVWDDLDFKSPVKVYDKYVAEPDKISDTYTAYKTQVVDGGVFIPSVKLNQPLQEECEHFLECIENGLPPRSGAVSGLRVVLAIEAAMESMRNNSQMTPIRQIDNSNV